MPRTKKLFNEWTLINKVAKMNRQDIPATLENIEESCKKIYLVEKNLIKDPNYIKKMVNFAVARSKLLKSSTELYGFEYRTPNTTILFENSIEFYTGDIPEITYFESLNIAQNLIKENSLTKGITGRDFSLRLHFDGHLLNYSMSSIYKQIIEAGINRGEYIY